MKKILIVILILYAQINWGQLTIYPSIGTHLSNANLLGNFQEELEKKGYNKKSFTFGFLLTDSLTKNFESSLRTTFSRIKLKARTDISFDPHSRYEIDNIYMRNAFRINLKFKNFRVGTGLNINSFILDIYKSWEFYGLDELKYGFTSFASYGYKKYLFELGFDKDLGGTRQGRWLLMDTFTFSVSYGFEIKEMK